MAESAFDSKQKLDANSDKAHKSNAMLSDNRAAAQFRVLVDNRTAQLAKKPNNTGLPDNLKSGIESLSGMSMDNVKVHYNSHKPAQLNAHAYAQGNNIHVAPGQEKHLPHEAWHVVQQAQGRVRPTMQMKGNVPVNDDKGLEREADAMGGRAAQAIVFLKHPRDGEREHFSKDTVQRIPYGTGHGTDSDRNTITTEALGPDEQVRATGDARGRAIIDNMMVNGVNQVGKVLKHYMVVKSGFRFQFPVKHVLQPEEGAHGGFVENIGDSYGHRAGAAEGFGGNQDLAAHAQMNTGIAASRNQTLDHEYDEENHMRNGANLNARRTVKFAGARMAGTMSIMDTDDDLESDFHLNARGPFHDRGMAEMAGNVVVNCADLINTAMNKDALEAEIGRRVEVQRRAMFGFYPRLRGHRAVASSVANQGGIFAHLVGMVADYLLAERARRQAEREARNRERIAFFVHALLGIGLAWVAGKVIPMLS